jgi:hypothetical protein
MDIAVEVKDTNSTGREGSVYRSMLTMAVPGTLGDRLDLEGLCRKHGLDPKKVTLQQMLAAARRERRDAGLPSTEQLAGRLK